MIPLHCLQNSSRHLRSLSPNAAHCTSLEYSTIHTPLSDAGASYLVSWDQLRFSSSFLLCSHSDISTVPI